MDDILLLIFFAVFVGAVVLAVALVFALRKTKPADAKVVCIAGPAKGAQAKLKNGRLSIGRSSDNDIAIPASQEPFISEHHADVRVDEQGRFVLEDCDSVHGVWMGDQRLIGQRVIAPGAQFAIGSSLFQLTGQATRPPAQAAAAPAERTRSIQQNPAQISARIEGYEQGEEIARGGQAVVYRGYSRDAERRPVVIKHFFSQTTDEERTYLRKKFEQQIVTATLIRHPHCVTVYGGDPRATDPYLIEEYLPGGSLGQKIKNRHLSADELVRVVGEACDALNYLHKQGIVHRDVTPGNLMFAADGSLKLIDFGVAHVISSITNTSLGKVLGKPKYMAPEQCKGLPVSPQSDLYSLACVAYECLTGSPPFVGSETDVMRGHISRAPRPMRDLNPMIPPALERAVMKGLEKEPGLRYKNGEDMARAFGYTAPMHDGGVTRSNAVKIAPEAVGLGVSQKLRLQDVATGKIFEIQAPGETLGREKIAPQDPAVSRIHGRVVMQNGLWQIMEIPESPSRNGIYYNNMRIGGAEAHWLKPGDEIRLGSVRLKVLE